MAKKLRGQLFARLALDYFDHPKIAALSSDAIVAHLEMLVYSRRYLTDGVIPMRVAMRYALHVVDELASNDPENPSVIRCDDGSLILQLVTALIAAGAIYGGIRSDLRQIHESVRRVEAAADKAHARIDNLTGVGRRNG